MADEKRKRKNEKVGPLEWAVSALGGLLLIAALVFLISRGVAARDNVPRFTASLGRVQSVPGGFHAAVEVRNESDATVAGLVLEGEITGGGQEPERSETTFDFVPGRSTRKGGLFFTRDPRNATVTLLPKGYQEP